MLTLQKQLLVALLRHHCQVAVFLSDACPCPPLIRQERFLTEPRSITEHDDWDHLVASRNLFYEDLNVQFKLLFLGLEAVHIVLVDSGLGQVNAIVLSQLHIDRSHLSLQVFLRVAATLNLWVGQPKLDLPADDDVENIAFVFVPEKDRFLWNEQVVHALDNFQEVIAVNSVLLERIYSREVLDQFLVVNVISPVSISFQSSDNGSLLWAEIFHLFLNFRRHGVSNVTEFPQAVIRNCISC